MPGIPKILYHWRRRGGGIRSSWPRAPKACFPQSRTPKQTVLFIESTSRWSLVFFLPLLSGYPDVPSSSLEWAEVCVEYVEEALDGPSLMPGRSRPDARAKVRIWCAYIGEHPGNEVKVPTFSDPFISPPLTVLDAFSAGFGFEATTVRDVLLFPAEYIGACMPKEDHSSFLPATHARDCRRTGSRKEELAGWPSVPSPSNGSCFSRWRSLLSR